jgi:hypothetical protein
MPRYELVDCPEVANARDVIFSNTANCQRNFARQFQKGPLAVGSLNDHWPDLMLRGFHPLGQ